MTTVQTLPITWDILEKMPSQSSSVVTLLYNDASIPGSQYGLTDPYVCNAFLTELYAYCEIDSLAASPLPDYQLEDTESEKIVKTLDAVWGTNTPKFYLQFWRWKASVNEWWPRGKISLINNEGYPYTLSRPLDLLTDNIARDMAAGHKLGVSVVDAGYGLLNTIDFVILDGCWRQDVRIIRPEQPIISVQGASVTNVVQYQTIQSSTTGTSRKVLLAANGNRISATVQNTHASNTIYLAYSDYTPSATTNDGAIPAGGSRVVTSGYKGNVWSVGSGINTSYTVTEVYQQ